MFLTVRIVGVKLKHVSLTGLNCEQFNIHHRDMWMILQAHQDREELQGCQACQDRMWVFVSVDQRRKKKKKGMTGMIKIFCFFCFFYWHKGKEGLQGKLGEPGQKGDPGERVRQISKLYLLVDDQAGWVQRLNLVNFKGVSLLGCHATLNSLEVNKLFFKYRCI